MKRSLVTSLGMVLLAGSLYSTPSKAVVSMVTGSYPILISGLVVGAGGSLVVATAGRPIEDFLLVTLLGVVLLDGEHEQRIEFTSLNKDQGRKLGITEAERRSYNSEIDQVNFIVEEVLLGIESTTKDVEASKRAWADVKDSVSPETFFALTKIARQSLK